MQRHGHDTADGLNTQLGAIFLCQLLNGYIKCRIRSQDNGRTLAILGMQALIPPDKRGEHGRDTTLMYSIADIVTTHASIMHDIPEFKDSKHGEGYGGGEFKSWLGPDAESNGYNACPLDKWLTRTVTILQSKA